MEELHICSAPSPSLSLSLVRPSLRKRLRDDGLCLRRSSVARVALAEEEEEEEEDEEEE